MQHQSCHQCDWLCTLYHYITKSPSLSPPPSTTEVTYTGIRAATGLGKAECSHMLPGGYFRQVLGLLLFRPIQQNPLEANRLRQKSACRE